MGSGQYRPPQGGRAELPTTLDDRAQDSWEPLLAIADLAGTRWSLLARDAARVLSGAEMQDQLDNFAALQRMNHGDMKATIAQIISIAKAHSDHPFYAISQAVRSAPAAPADSYSFSASAITRDNSASPPPKK